MRCCRRLGCSRTRTCRSGDDVDAHRYVRSDLQEQDAGRLHAEIADVEHRGSLHAQRVAAVDHHGHLVLQRTGHAPEGDVEAAEAAAAFEAAWDRFVLAGVESATWLSEVEQDQSEEKATWRGPVPGASVAEKKSFPPGEAELPSRVRAPLSASNL